jgi:ribonuclease/clavin/mitogillin
MLNLGIMLSTKIEVIEKESAKIYRMATLDLQGNPIMWVSAFLIDGLLIDFGHHHAKDLFLKALNFNEIEMCVLSHQHEDHYGACYDLINKYKMPIYSTKEIAFLVRLKLRLPPERLLTWGNPKPCILKELPNLKEIETTNAKFKIIRSPGHCNTLISFYHEKKRLLFSTDAFINSEQSVIFNWENANKMLKTLNNFRKLNPKYLFLESGDLATISDVEKLIN